MNHCSPLPKKLLVLWGVGGVSVWEGMYGIVGQTAGCATWRHPPDRTAGKPPSTGERDG